MTPHRSVKTLLLVTLCLVGAHEVEAQPQSFAKDNQLLVPAGRCGKYKEDGTGNCLTPAFYQCQEEWAKCTKSCNSDQKCQDVCDEKYSAECGD